MPARPSKMRIPMAPLLRTKQPVLGFKMVAPGASAGLSFVFLSFSAQGFRVSRGQALHAASPQYINSMKDGCEKSITFKVRIDEIRTIRNKLLKESDYYLLPDIGLTDQKLNDIKVYRKELREFMNKLMNDEMKIDIFDDDIERKYFPKLILEESVPA
jgi:putative N-acetylmannosamine-6-phosphate epimerase